LRCTLLTNLSTLHRWQRNFSEAATLADEALGLALHHQAGLEGHAARMALLAVYAQQNQVPKAQIREELDQIITELRHSAEDFALLSCMGLCAQVAILDGDRLAASQHLRSALLQADKLGTTQPLVTEILHSAELESFVEENRSAFGVLLRDLKRLREFQIRTSEENRLSVTGKLSTYHLRLFCLGEARILRDGEPVDSVMLRRLGRDLFLCLLFEGGATREQVSVLLWPQSTVQKVRQNFHTLIFRMRQALGENVVILRDQRYSINPDVEVWCDALELEKMVKKARLLSPRDARTEDMWQRAVDLYRGDFLPEVDAEWTTYRRESLRDNYIDALIGLAQCARVRSDFPQALYYFKHAAELEPYREDIHQGILNCYAAKGDKQKIVTHVTNLRRLMRRDLGASPSLETLNLAQSLLK